MFDFFKRLFSRPYIQPEPVKEPRPEFWYTFTNCPNVETPHKIGTIEDCLICKVIKDEEEREIEQGFRWISFDGHWVDIGPGMWSFKKQHRKQWPPGPYCNKCGSDLVDMNCQTCKNKNEI